MACRNEKDVTRDARMQIQRYFQDKKVLNRVDLYSESSVKILMETDFDSGLEYAHNYLLHHIEEPQGWDNSILKWEVHVLLNMLEEMRDLNIPKSHQPGMVLLHFKHCFGLKIPDPKSL